MGLLVDGIWQDDTGKEFGSRNKDGHFVRAHNDLPRLCHRRRQPRTNRQRRLSRRTGRYHLYVSLACPWAHRTLIFRKLKKLEDVISISVMAALLGPDRLGIRYRAGRDARHRQRQILARRGLPACRPALQRPRERAGAVGQEATHHRQQRIRRNHPHAELGIRRLSPTCTPTTIRSNCGPKSTASTTIVYPNVNNGVYRTGFATTQAAYEEAARALFATLDQLEERLSRQRYLVGRRITEADWRLFTTLVRFDAVYYSHFKCNIRRIIDYPNLWNYLRDLYQVPGVAETVSLDHIKRHYYGSHRKLNPSGIVPIGPLIDFTLPHDRGRFA